MPVAICVIEGVSVSELDWLWLDDEDPERDCDCVPVANCEGVPVRVSEAVAVGDCVCEADAVSVPVWVDELVADCEEEYVSLDD